MMKRTLKLWGFVLVLTSYSSPSFAYYSTIDTGEILDEGQYRTSLESQFITDPGDGINLVGRFDAPIDDETNWRVLLGFGETDFQLGGFVRWTPIPDLENQPAISLLGGVLYAREGGDGELSLRLHPIISKKFQLELGDLTPYASLPFGLRSYKDDTDIPLQLAIGTQFKPLSFEKISFAGEVGFDLSDAYTYFSLAAIVGFDQETGFQLK